MKTKLLKNAWLHFKKICIHKYWVAHYCFKVGLYWQGIVHDLSKFSPTEFFESVKYYQGDSSPINAAKADKGYSLAWQHHKGRNPHHYEYWTDNYDSGTTCITMPFRYAAELICDYLGAARAYIGKDFSYKEEYYWWMKKSTLGHPKMSTKTKTFITRVFDMLYFDGELHSEEKLSKKNLLAIYDKYSNPDNCEVLYIEHIGEKVIGGTFSTCVDVFKVITDEPSQDFLMYVDAWYKYGDRLEEEIRHGIDNARGQKHRPTNGEHLFELIKDYYKQYSKL